MRGPGVRVGAGVAGDFRPGAEVERQQLAPWTERGLVLVRHSRVIQRPRQVKAEVIRRAEDAVGIGPRGDGKQLAENLLLAIFGITS